VHGAHVKEIQMSVPKPIKTPILIYWGTLNLVATIFEEKDNKIVLMASGNRGIV
jgi:hypothetical protein